MGKNILLYEEWQFSKPQPMQALRGGHARHNNLKDPSSETQETILSLTDDSIKILLNLANEFFPDEYIKWQKHAKQVSLFVGDVPDNQQELKTREIKFTIDGICKTKKAVFGRLKSSSFADFSSNIIILSNDKEINITDNLNYRNINSINLTGYIRTI